MTYNPKNKDLFDTCKEFIKKASSGLKKDYGEYMNEKLNMHLANPFNIFAFGSDELLVPSNLMKKRLGELKHMQEFNHCEYIMQNDPYISKHIGKYVGTSFCGKLMYPSDYLFHILEKILDDSTHNTLEFNEFLFNRLYSDLEYLFYNDEIPVVYLAPLKNFTTDLDAIDLKDGLLIRRVKPGEAVFTKYREELYDVDESKTKYVIELKTKEKKFVETDMNKIKQSSGAKERIDSLITALRLFRKGDVELSYIECTISPNTHIETRYIIFSGFQS